jgi:hypothetical protein
MITFNTNLSRVRATHILKQLLWYVYCCLFIYLATDLGLFVSDTAHHMHAGRGMWCGQSGWSITSESMQKLQAEGGSAYVQAHYAMIDEN